MAGLTYFRGEGRYGDQFVDLVVSVASNMEWVKHADRVLSLLPCNRFGVRICIYIYTDNFPQQEPSRALANMHFQGFQACNLSNRFSLAVFTRSFSGPKAFPKLSDKREVGNSALLFVFLHNSRHQPNHDSKMCMIQTDFRAATSGTSPSKPS